MLPKNAIREVFRAYRGSQAQLVKRLRTDGDGRGSPAAVSLWMQGKSKSARIHRLASEFALEISERRSRVNDATGTIPAQWWRL